MRPTVFLNGLIALSTEGELKTLPLLNIKDYEKK
tara:strand:+ start:1504 stop:1605 length:102 start_codon:yes stop_codon:yes gene_type:complete